MEIYVGQSDYIYLDLFVTTATGTPTATLIRAGSANLPLTVSLVSPTPAGTVQRWQAYIPLTQTVSAGDFSVTWTAVVGSENITVNQYYEVVTPYVLPEELAATYGWSFNPLDSNYRPREEVAAAERIARYTINSYTRRAFGPVTKSVVAYGQNTDVLVLGEPIVSPTKMYENGELVVTVGGDFTKFGYDIEVTETGSAIRVVSPDFLDLDEYESQRITGTAGKFRAGYRYTVEGVFGTASIPQIVKDCVGMLANDYLCRDATWRNRYINHVQMRDWKFTFEKEAFRGTGNLTVDRLLGDYQTLGIFTV
jgi:hypothetical protein